MSRNVHSQEFKPRRDGALESLIGDGETQLDMYKMQYLYNSYWGLEAAQISKDALQARVFCEIFNVIVTGLGSKKQKINRVTKMVIEEYWMPTLLDIHDYLIMFGVCPYIWKKIPKSDHVYPVVPPWGTYFITYNSNRDGTNFHLYWLDKVMPEEGKNVFWVKGSKYPQGGRFRSTMATLETLYKMQMRNANATLKAIDRAANPHFVFENSPQSGKDLADFLAVEEAFGEREVFKQMQSKEEMMAHRSSLRKENLQNSIINNNFKEFGGSIGKNHSETYNDFLTHSIILDPGFKVQGSPTPEILMKMDEIWMKLSRDCAAMIGFPLEFAQPMGAARAANVEGNIRFLNESVKKLRKDFRAIVRRMWLVSYGQLIFNEAEKVKRRMITQPSLRKEFEMNKQIEIEIEWPCIPEMSYDQLRQFVLDEVISHETMACQAAGLFGLPSSIINCKGGKLPEQKTAELQEKQFKLQVKAQKQQAELAKQSLNSSENDDESTRPTEKRKERPMHQKAPESAQKKLKGTGKTLSMKKTRKTEKSANENENKKQKTTKN